MKYIKSHKDFAKHVNETLDLNIPEKELEKIDEAFQNDVTLSNSLIGQLFGWIFRKIGMKIKKGQMKALLEELANEFGKGQYSAVRHKNIAKKNAVYSTIVGLKNLANNDSISDDDFINKFSKELDKALEEYRELIEGKGNVRIEDADLMKVAKDFYSKLNRISSNPVELKAELSEDDESAENAKAEFDIDNVNLDESITPNAQLFKMLEFAGDSKLDVIATNLESQLPGKNIIVGDNLIKIEESKLSFEEIDRYFRALNMSVELINDAIIIDNYDRIAMLLEYTETGKNEFLYDLKDDIEVILNTELLTKGNRLRGVVVSKDSDYEEKGEAVYNTIFNKINKEGIRLSQYSKLVNRFNDKNLKKAYDNMLRYLEKFKYSKDDSSGFKSNYSNLIRAMEATEGMLKSHIDSIDKQRSQRLESEEKEVTERPVTDTDVPLTWDNKGRLSVNTKQFNKLGETDTRIKFIGSDGSIKDGRLNPHQPEDIDEEIGMINIFTSSGTTVAIDGAKIREVGGISTPNGILNRGHQEAREKRKVEQSDWEKSVDELSWLLDKDIEYKKDGSTKGVHVLSKEEQLKDKGIPGGLKVKAPDEKDANGNITSKGQVYFLKDIKDKIISQEGKPIDSDNLLENRDYVRSMLNSLFTDDKFYERELILNERDKKDLLNDIKHKAKNNETLINPLQVMKIFNKAHYKYTVEDYSSIPDGKQGSTLQGKGKGVNKKKDYKQMPDGSGRQVALFKQWNEGVIDLLEEYGDSIPDKLKRFIIAILNDNTIFGKGGAQAKLLQEYFNIKVDMADVLSGETGRGTATKVQTTKSDVYLDTKDITGVFGESKSGSLQMKKENFHRVPFIMKGEFENIGETALVCYYMGTLNDTILFKYKENNIDFLNNYKKEEQTISDQDFIGAPGTGVKYGVIRTPKGANKDLKVLTEMPIWSTDVKLKDSVELNNFKVNGLYYLQGENDGGVMRLDSKRPGSQYGDFQIEDIKSVWQKFTADSN